MGNLLYILAFVLLVVWAIASFGFQAGGTVHLLIPLAIIAILFRVLKQRPI